MRAQNASYIHSPFIFEWYNAVHAPIQENDLSRIESYREFLAKSKDSINLEENGQTVLKPIAKRYQSTSISPRYGKLLYQTSKYIRANHFLELGASLGVSAMYLTLSNPSIRGTSIDYMHSSIEFCKARYQELGLTNDQFIQGSFEEVLPRILSNDSPLDLVFIDGDHSYEATMNNTQRILPFLSANAVVILDDIRWSAGMYRAWEELKSNADFNYSVDYGRIGLLFKIENGLVKQDFILK